MLSAPSRLPLHCAETPSVDRSVSEIHRQRVYSEVFQSQVFRIATGQTCGIYVEQKVFVLEQNP